MCPLYTKLERIFDNKLNCQSELLRSSCYSGRNETETSWEALQFCTRSSYTLHKLFKQRSHMGCTEKIYINSWK